MGLLLGIDTGGTYTDAVLCDPDHHVLRRAKALTRHDDLAASIAEALNGVMSAAQGPVDLVSLSTTLATNALVEGQGGPVGLILVGQSRDFLQRSGLGEALGGDPVILLDGGHDAAGNERAPLDVDTARHVIAQHAPRVGAFAVSSFFATRNPAHERRLQQLVHELTGLPVSTGHELSAALDAPRRALTALFNARLIGLLSDLINAVRRQIAAWDIAAPLMVVRGDGALMSADFAVASPVETILSGPAASLVGARVLAGEPDSIVLDIGGTTSDIGALEGGEPQRSREGAVVGGWRTRVEAVAVQTHGLGGDSAVRLGGVASTLHLGPDRIMPLALLGTLHPSSRAILAEQADEQPLREHAGWFALRQREPVGGADSLSAGQRLLWSRLGDGPVALVRLFDDQTRLRALQRLVARGLVVLSGFTPTDAAHVLGGHDAWCAEAAGLGARIWTRRAWERLGRDLGDEEAFARHVQREMVIAMARAVLGYALADTELAPDGSLVASARALIDRSLRASAPHPRVAVDVRLNVPLLVLGAPAARHGEALGERLGTRVVVPACADVANAVGAVAAGVVQRVVATITPLPDDRFRVHTPEGVHTCGTLDEARRWAATEVERMAAARAAAAGAQGVEVEIARDETIGHSETGDEVFFEGTVSATARGRPALARAMDHLA